MPDKKLLFLEKIKANDDLFHPVVSFDPRQDRIASLDCSSNNLELTQIDLTDTVAFSEYIDHSRLSRGARYLIGGYNEDRSLYSRSDLFDKPSGKTSHNEKSAEDELPRTLHLGTDIWGEAGSKIFAPLGGRVHSFAYNNHFGDYGATLILLHQLDGLLFHTLYGHLSLKDLGNKSEGKFLNRGECIAHFGISTENGHWPPHLHFQIILDMKNYKGDYPGVCSVNEKSKYLENSPDPDMVLNLNKYLKSS